MFFLRGKEGSARLGRFSSPTRIYMVAPIRIDAWKVWKQKGDGGGINIEKIYGVCVKKKDNDAGRKKCVQYRK